MQPERPASFDAAVVAHIPYIERFVRKLAPRDDVEEITQDVLAYAMNRWNLYRPADGSIGTWLAWQVRSIVKQRRDKAKTLRKHFSDADPEAVLAVRSSQPQQENIVMANQTLRRLSRSRGGRMLVRVASGELMREVGAKRGVTHQRVHQLIEEARVNLKKVAA